MRRAPPNPSSSRRRRASGISRVDPSPHPTFHHHRASARASEGFDDDRVRPTRVHGAVRGDQDELRDKSHPRAAKRSSTRASRVDASASIPSTSTRTIFDPGTRGPMVPSPSVAPTRASIATCMRCVVTFSSTASASISLVKLEHHDADDADVEDGSLDSANPFSRGSIAPVAPCRSRARVTRREPIAFILNHLHRRVACMHPSVRRHHHR